MRSAARSVQVGNGAGIRNPATIPLNPARHTARLAPLWLLIWAPPALAAHEQLEVEHARISIDLPDSQDLRSRVLPWVTRSAQIVAHYYGSFPTPELKLQVNVLAGEGVQGGQTFGRDGGFIRVTVGRDVTVGQLENDWVLVHEMIHLALPDVGAEHAWLSEGVATYIEGVARVRAGNRSKEDFWGELVQRMPRGMPDASDEGLDHTHTWGRTYWGGAIFCLLADVQLRKRTDGRAGLGTALRAILRASGGLSSDWPITRVLATGDAATGTRVLEELYAQMKDTPRAPDLGQLWRELGVQLEGGEVRFDPAAPLAWVREAITSPETGSAQPHSGSRQSHSRFNSSPFRIVDISALVATVEALGIRRIQRPA